MSLARRAIGKYKAGALAILLYRAGSWLWFWEQLADVTSSDPTHGGKR